jgi:hypothetical protein
MKMTRYYFHVRGPEGFVKDPEGAEFASDDVAVEEARAAARELMAAKVAKGEIVDGGQFEITTEDGDVINTVIFKSVVKID